MKYLICVIAAVSLLSACGGGTRYSSQRAQQPAQTYIPVTPGAVPVTPVTVGAGVPAAPVVQSGAIEPAPVLSGATSLRPQARRQVGAPVQVAATPTPVIQAAAPAPVARFATGPIYTACKAGGRKAATKARCGCIQAVADRELTPAQQRRGAGYFDDQHKLQQVRQSDSASNEAFWTAWKAYGKAAARQCS